MMHHEMPFQKLSSMSHAKDKHGGGGSKHCFAGNLWWNVKQGSMDMTQSKGIKWKDQ
jgi:hypothetical protein